MPRRRSVRPKKTAKLTYELIQPDTETGRPLYALLADLLERHHEDLYRTDARIALAWCTSWKPDVDGRVTLGKCRKASDLDRELMAFDFVLLLSRAFFEDPRVTPQQCRALIDHELCHAAVKYDVKGEPVTDVRGRVVYRLFNQVVGTVTAENFILATVAVAVMYPWGIDEAKRDAKRLGVDIGDLETEFKRAAAPPKVEKPKAATKKGGKAAKKR